MKKYSLYIHENKINGKKYCGITSNVERRWRSNGLDYKHKSDRKPTEFYKAILKYGWNGFEHIILEEDLDYNIALIKEREYIQKHQLNDSKYGYNVHVGGEFDGKPYKQHPKGMLGKKHSEEYKKRLSEMMKGKNNPCQEGFWSEEGRTHPKGMLGKTHSEEKKKQISNTLKEKKINTKKIVQITKDKKIFIYDSRKEASEKLNISLHIIHKCLKNENPYKISKSVRSGNIEALKNIEGSVFKNYDDTELTEISKEIQ